MSNTLTRTEREESRERTAQFYEIITETHSAAVWTNSAFHHSRKNFKKKKNLLAAFNRRSAGTWKGDGGAYLDVSLLRGQMEGSDIRVADSVRVCTVPKKQRSDLRESFFACKVKSRLLRGEMTHRQIYREGRYVCRYRCRRRSDDEDTGYIHILEHTKRHIHEAKPLMQQNMSSSAHTH
jgi:hypothetical protein